MQIIQATEIDYESLPEDLGVVWDTENTDLLNESSIDYSSVPYRLRETFKNHCYVCIELDRDVAYTFAQEEIDTYFPKFARKVTHWVGQNSINYDHLVIKLAQNLDYTIEPDTLNGKPVKIDDTLVMSKTLNPDRFGHSLEYAGQILGYPKIDWRSEAVELGLIDRHAPQGAEFKIYHPRMLNYCIRDAEVNKKWYFYLLKEWGDWNWSEAYSLEKSVAEIITRQSHRGFKFDLELARANLNELDKLMEDIKLKVEPTLPPKKATKTLQKDYTPPATQFLKNGQPSSHIKKFAERVGGSIGGSFDEGYKLMFNAQEHPLPFNYSLVTESPMTLADSTQIKEYLVKDFKWRPTSYKERDLTADAKKKKITKEKFLIAAEKYIEQTLESAFCEDRCEHLGCKPSELRDRILSHDVKKPLKVLTNPSFTVGQEKELCPGLERIAKDYPHAQDIAHWLTYRHRRNSILGGGIDYDDEENIDKGFLNFVRQDGRIPTPADTCGAGTSRFKHRVCANIPRVTSLYGDKMRGMFGADTSQCYQLGYDFDSLEAKITGHYIWKYPGGPELAHALIAEKPNDVHCYSEDTEILTEGGWKVFGNLLDSDLVAQWEEGRISFVKPLEIVWQDYIGKMIHISSGKLDMLVTPEHRMLITCSKSPHKNSVILAKDMTTRNSDNRMFSSGNLKTEEKLNLGATEIQLLVAIQADGHLNKDSSGITFNFVKERKIERLKMLLQNINVSYTEKKIYRGDRPETVLRIKAGDVVVKLRSFLTTYKNFKQELMLLNHSQASIFLEELKYWDGTERKNGDTVLDSTDLNSAELIQTLAHLNGRKCQLRSYTKKTTHGSCKIFRCYLGKGAPWYSYHTASIKSVDYVGKIGCVAVPSGFVLTRRNCKIIVSGNTLNAKRLGISRNDSKTFFYAALYGAQPNKLAKQLGWPISKAKKIFNDFWEACKPIQLLRENLMKYWEKVGNKQFILGIDGRKIPTRSQHALLNSLFQSGGVICAKRAMVIHDSMLKNKGLSIDFFKDEV